jgi:ribosome-binding factor A
MLKNLDDCLKTRAAWVFVEILEHDNTKHLVVAELKENAKVIQKLLKSKDLKGTMGLQRIQKHIS